MAQSASEESSSAREATPAAERSFDEAFRGEFAAHFSSLFRYLDRLGGDPDLAADSAQEAFVRLYQRGDVPDDTRAWLAVVGRNLLQNALAKSRRRRRLLAREEARGSVSVPNPSLASSLEAARRRKSVRDALERMPERERLLLLLRYEGFSYREIARTLELKETSVGTLLVRAKQTFRRALEDQGDAP